MKKTKALKTTILAIGIASTFIASSEVQAQLGIPNFPFDLTYEQDPDGFGPITIGTPFRGGVQIFVEGLDAGTLYSPLAVGTSVGGNGAGAIGILNSQFQTPAPNNRGDDTWGIGYVTRIVDPITNANVWTPLVKNQQITGMFYGAQDIFLRQDTATSQTIAAKGFTLDLYLQQGQLPVPSFAGVTPADRVAGPAGLSQFPNFTNPPTASLGLLARFNSTNGFLAPGGVTDTEFLAQFTASLGAQGSAQGFASVDNTMGQLQGIGGPSIFENNQFKGIESGIDLDPGTPGIQNDALADARFVFSTQTLPNFTQPNNWTVAVTGPILTNVIPEPSTVLFGFSCLVPALIGRRRKSVVA